DHPPPLSVARELATLCMRLLRRQTKVARPCPTLARTFRAPAPAVQPRGPARSTALLQASSRRVRTSAKFQSLSSSPLRNTSTSSLLREGGASPIEYVRYSRVVASRTRSRRPFFETLA